MAPAALERVIARLKLKNNEYFEIIKSLHGFERMTWNQIKQVAGGRSSGTNRHLLTIDDFSKEAKKRLKQLKLDDNDELFSLRLNNTLRYTVFGTVVF